MKRRAPRIFAVGLTTVALWGVCSVLRTGAAGDGTPDSTWIGTTTIEDASDTVIDVGVVNSDSLVTVNDQAAILAAGLLLTPIDACDTDQCQDTDGICKRCAAPVSNGVEPTASDALMILRVSVGQGTCAACVCDADGNGNIVASDALLVLKRAVGQSVTLNCPPA